MAEMGAFRRQPSGGALSHLFNPASSLGGNASLANALDDLPFDLFLSGVLGAWDDGFTAPALLQSAGDDLSPGAAQGGHNTRRGRKQQAPSAAGSARNAGAPRPVPPPSLSAPAPASGPSGQPWRCLDTSHSAVCLDCQPPPLDGEEGLYELVGDPGKKNGEKKLRALLARCPEWSDDAARLTLAADLSGAGAPSGDFSRLVSCLKGLDTMAALRKTDLITLARSWGYKCNQWRRRRACSRATHRVMQDLAGQQNGHHLLPPQPLQQQQGVRAAAQAAGDSAALAAAAPHPPSAQAAVPRGGDGAAAASPSHAHTGFAVELDLTGVTAETLAAYARQRLLPLKMQSLALLRGEEARESAMLHGWGHITEQSCEAVSRTAARLVANEPERQHNRQTILALRTEFADRLQEPAWPFLAGRMSDSAFPLLEWLRRMHQLLDRSVTVIDAAATLNSRAAAPAPAAWLDELRRARVTSLQLNLRCQTLLNNALWHNLATFTDACLVACDTAGSYVLEAAKALEHREAWMRELMNWSTLNGAAATAADAREVTAAAALLYVSPFAQEQQHLISVKEREAAGF